MFRILIFTLTMTFFAILAWVAGYDFQTRSPAVAYILFCAVVFSVLAAILSPKLTRTDD